MADGFDFGGLFGDFGGDPSSPITSGDFSGYGGLSDILRSGAGTGGSPFSGLTTGLPDTSGSGWGDLASQLFGGLKEYGLPALQGATGAMSIGSGILGGIRSGQTANLEQQALRRQAQLSKLAQEQAKPMADFSQAQIGAAEQGRIPPAVQAQINQWAQGAKIKVMQSAAARGVSAEGDSSVQAQLAWIDQTAQAMQAQALQDEISSGIAAGGVAINTIGTGGAVAGGAGYQSAGEMGGLNALIQAANQAMARLG